MDRFYQGVGYVVLSALGFALLPILAVYAYEGGINVTTLLLIRFIIASVLVLGYILTKTKRLSLLANLGPLVVLAVLYTIQSSTYFLAVKYIPPQLVVLLLYTNPIIVDLLTFLLDKSTISRRVITASGVSFLGLIMVLGLAWSKINFTGIGLALMSAFFYSVYIVFGNRLVKKVPALQISAFVMVFAALCLGFIGVITGGINWNFAPITWIYILLLVAFSTVLPMLSFFASLPRIGPNRAAMLSMVEPIFTIILSTLLLGEGLSLWQWVGTFAVLGGALYVVVEPKPAVVVKKRVS